MNCYFKMLFVALFLEGGTNAPRVTRAWRPRRWELAVSAAAEMGLNLPEQRRAASYDAISEVRAPLVT